MPTSTRADVGIRPYDMPINTTQTETYGPSETPVPTTQTAALSCLFVGMVSMPYNFTTTKNGMVFTMPFYYFILSTENQMTEG